MWCRKGKGVSEVSKQQLSQKKCETQCFSVPEAGTGFSAEFNQKAGAPWPLTETSEFAGGGGAKAGI